MDESTRRIEIGALTRVEGEGALRVTIRNGQPTDVQLAIYEPPRFFEALLRGRPLEDAPDITARICGICPIAYQMTAVHALEQALEIEVNAEIRSLRRLLYCAEWIESHGVHMHLLHIPDFFDCKSSLELAKRFPAEVTRGLQLKKLGNTLLEILGGRAVHPINVAVGGFYKAPSADRLRSLRDPLRKAIDAAVQVVRWTADFAYPESDADCEMVALVHPDEYPMNAGEIHSTEGLRIPVERFEQAFAERQVPHSTALHSVRLPAGTPYLVGPLARVNLNRPRLSPTAYDLSNDLGMSWPCTNTHRSLIARGLEVVHALETALTIVESYRGCPQPRATYAPQAGEGMWATEAPRGLIYHRYRIDEAGVIQLAKIIPPTSQNQGQIESELGRLLPGLLEQDDAAIALSCEKLIRAYDPCISCATHFLKLEIVRDGVE